MKIDLINYKDNSNEVEENIVRFLSFFGSLYFALERNKEIIIIILLYDERKMVIDMYS